MTDCLMEVESDILGLGLREGFGDLFWGGGLVNRNGRQKDFGDASSRSCKIAVAGVWRLEASGEAVRLTWARRAGNLISWYVEPKKIFGFSQFFVHYM